MKRIFFIMLMVLSFTTGYSQIEPGFRTGARVNAGITNVVGDGDDASFGWGIGWIAEYNFSSKFYLQSGLGLEDIAHTESAVDGTLHGYFLQLPIHAGYRFGLSDSTNLFIQAGPALAFGLFGSKIQWDNGRSDNYFDLMKRFDIGVGGRVGVEFNKIKISLGANYGLLDAADGNAYSDYHNLSANIAVGYMF